MTKTYMDVLFMSLKGLQRKSSTFVDEILALHELERMSEEEVQGHGHDPNDTAKMVEKETQQTKTVCKLLSLLKQISNLDLQAVG